MCMCVSKKRNTIGLLYSLLETKARSGTRLASYTRSWRQSKKRNTIGLLYSLLETKQKAEHDWLPRRPKTVPKPPQDSPKPPQDRPKPPRTILARSMKKNPKSVDLLQLLCFGELWVKISHTSGSSINSHKSLCFFLISWLFVIRNYFGSKGVALGLHWIVKGNLRNAYKITKNLQNQQ